MTELGHGLPERRVQEDLAHHVTLQGGGVALQVAHKLLLSQVQVLPEHVDVQVVPVGGKGGKKNIYGCTSPNQKSWDEMNDEKSQFWVEFKQGVEGTGTL